MIDERVEHASLLLELEENLQGDVVAIGDAVGRIVLEGVLLRR